MLLLICRYKTEHFNKEKINDETKTFKGNNKRVGGYWMEYLVVLVVILTLIKAIIEDDGSSNK
mgnify:CR=1 FL=1